MGLTKILVIGAGDRGTMYGRLAVKEFENVRVVGVAEPRPERRERLARELDIPPENVFTDWREAADRPQFADIAIVTTLDALHEAPTIALAEKGYHVLLEKPMAPNAEACRRIVDTVLRKNVVFGVCHVLRYTAYTRSIKAVLDSGEIGETVSIQHLEPVGHWHQAHSFVRGNWRREDETAPMLLTKSCHDLDWIRYMMGVRCLKVSSFGSLRHFKPENQPKGAADRCLDCRVEPNCPYSAMRVYLKMVERGETWWPVSVITDSPTHESVIEALRTGPYGRCVYKSDNDVVDNQVVCMLFEGGKTASFTMTAFSNWGDRQTRIFGTHGEISGDGRYIQVRSFLTGELRKVDTLSSGPGTETGHGGGDYGVLSSFLKAVTTGDRSRILSGPIETLETHLMVFAAEKARRENRVVPVDSTT